MGTPLSMRIWRAAAVASLRQCRRDAREQHRHRIAGPEYAKKRQRLQPDPTPGRHFWSH